MGKDNTQSLTPLAVELGMVLESGTWPLCANVSPLSPGSELTAIGNRKMSTWQQLIVKM